jgi:CBS domain-containing protein
MAVLKAELKAYDVMTPEPVCVDPSTSIRSLARVFEDNEISGAPVVDAEGRVIGVVSKTDLIRRCSEGSADAPPAYLFEILCEQESVDGAGELPPEAVFCVEDFMSEDPLMVSPEMSAASIARELHERRLHRVIVVDSDQRPVGVVTSLDLLGHFSW